MVVYFGGCVVVYFGGCVVVYFGGCVVVYFGGNYNQAGSSCMLRTCCNHLFYLHLLEAFVLQNNCEMSIELE